MEEINIAIIGSGVVGLAIAAELSIRYENIVVMEKHETFGQETSSRNSEVIHSGIYYPEKSLKASLCVAGSAMLYEICEKQAIPHKKTGKIIVATEESEVSILEDLLKKGQNNGVQELKLLDKKETVDLEPNINAVASLYSPNTGIVDSHSLMKYFYNKAEDNGVLFSFNSDVVHLEKNNNDFIIGIKQDDYMIKSKIVINCAGLQSDYIAELAGINTEKERCKLKYCKGSYFSYAKPSPVKMLVYPVPHDELVGLGVHATLDFGGRLRFGPDAEYIDAVDFKVDMTKKEVFYEGALKIIPSLDPDAFIPDMAGIRPKLSGPGEKARDFIIRHEADKGLDGLINLIGIESPGLTASPAIARMVAITVSKLMA